MQTASRDRVGASLERLEPKSRALLELSLLRGVPDEDVAALLGISADGVRERREAVLTALGVSSDEDRAALRREMRREPERPSDPARPDGPPGAAGRPAPWPRRDPNLGRKVASLAALAIALAVAVGVALGGDEEGVGGDPGSQAPGTPADPVPPPADPASPPAADTGTLRALGGVEAEGDAAILAGEGARSRLRLTVSGLPRPPRGGYVVWLYNSVADSRALTGSRRGSFTVRTPLPVNAERFAFLDVSRERPDGDLGHSGASVFRVRLDEIPEG